MNKITFIVISSFLLASYNCFAQPANNSCSGTPEVLTIGEPGVCNATLVDLTNATDSGFTDGVCSSNGNADLWYTLTMPNADGVRVKTSRNVSSVDTKMAIYKGNDCGGLTLLGCNDDLADGVNFFSRINIIEPENTIIYIRVWDLENSGNSFNICAQKIEYAPNDDCENAITLPTSVTCMSSTGSNEGTDSTNNTDFGICSGSYEGSDVWFSVIVPSTGRFSVETSTDDGSIEDTVIAIYSGNCLNGLTFIKCSDDDGTDLFSYIELSERTQGETIYVRVWSNVNEEKGTFNICATELPSLSIKDSSINSFAIFPNPASNIVNFKFDNNYSGNISLKIYDLAGKLVLSSKKEIHNRRIQVNISNLLSGLYIVKVVNDNENKIVQKLIIR
ncbi:T9SS type A sorting domain-containing protein [uncultured Algibacter sp.]|uniref:T9SS type A sorting domain-containing protein n=1 Tax=uncultured Algibacter sp. TaxID=298659 RepID=UPI0026102A55|nr:T9SS type A sorting domain-containing protein [uncultured Algibacter sp.]